VPAEDADDVLGAIGGRGLVVVVRDSVDADGAVDTTPATATPAATSPAGPTG
jgi:hypothetical protein